MKKIFIGLLFMCGLAACTSNFVNENQNPYQISDALLQQDFNLVGSPFSGMLYQLHGDQGSQVEEDLDYDSWMGYMNTGTDFVGNVNNTTYAMTWRGQYWSREYGNIMSPAKQVIALAASNNLPLFATWAKLIKILSMSRVTAIHGPIIYSNYGSTANSIPYDKESDLYNLFFAQLDSIQTAFSANKAYVGFAKFDPSYNGNMGAWMKVVNSLRLQLAMRLSKVAPGVAQTQGEKALADPAGLIATNADNFLISQLGHIMPVGMICFQWDDTRMGGVIESFMVGMNDGRISKYFSPVSDPTLYADHPASPYKGIRNGSYITSKAAHINFSKVSNDFNTVQTRRHITAAEVSFLKAEAALRGWANAGDAGTNYQNGVRLSFADWGGANVDAYLADKTSKPIGYVDPVDARNNFSAVSTITIAWNEADSKELKLEKIITQKWLNGFTNTLESWVDFRRTGYPKIPHVAKNDSPSAAYGIVAPDQWIKRMEFTDSERLGNAAAVATATSSLGGPDQIGTRLWWDTGGSNF